MPDIIYIKEGRRAAVSKNLQNIVCQYRAVNVNKQNKGTQTANIEALICPCCPV